MAASGIPENVLEGAHLVELDPRCGDPDTPPPPLHQGSFSYAHDDARPHFLMLSSVSRGGENLHGDYHSPTTFGGTKAVLGDPIGAAAGVGEPYLRASAGLVWSERVGDPATFDYLRASEIHFSPHEAHRPPADELQTRSCGFEPNPGPWSLGEIGPQQSFTQPYGTSAVDVVDDQPRRCFIIPGWVADLDDATAAFWAAVYGTNNPIRRDSFRALSQPPHPPARAEHPPSSCARPCSLPSFGSPPEHQADVSDLSSSLHGRRRADVDSETASDLVKSKNSDPAGRQPHPPPDTGPNILMEFAELCSTIPYLPVPEPDAVLAGMADDVVVFGDGAVSLPRDDPESQRQPQEASADDETDHEVDIDVVGVSDDDQIIREPYPCVKSDSAEGSSSPPNNSNVASSSNAGAARPEGNGGGRVERDGRGRRGSDDAGDDGAGTVSASAGDGEGGGASAPVPGFRGGVPRVTIVLPDAYRDADPRRVLWFHGPTTGILFPIVEFDADAGLPPIVGYDDGKSQVMKAAPYDGPMPADGEAIGIFDGSRSFKVVWTEVDIAIQPGN